MKSKTLKDFESHIEESIHNRLCKKLKEEAIKRYKHFAKLKSDLYILGKMHLLEEFFDLTEEDLK